MLSMTDEDEDSNVVPIVIENVHIVRSSAPTLRSILRKRPVCHRTSLTINDSHGEERDSDYTGEDDEGEEEEEEQEEEEKETSCSSNISVEKEGKTRGESSCANHCNESSFVASSSSPSLTSPRKSSSFRRPCVTFAEEQSPIVERSSSSSFTCSTDVHHSVTFVNMKDDVHAASSTLTSDFRPVYVSPLKYRPLLGLSANDSRLLLEKRVSLLGKPVTLHTTHKRSANYRRAQLVLYNFLERAHGYKAIVYHTFVFITVFICLFLSVVVTLPEYEAIATTVLLPSEIIVFIWLSLELSLRVWSAGCRSRYQTLVGRLRFLRKPFCALDLIMILATVLTLCLNIRSGNGVFAASALRGLRFFQILRMLRMDRRAGTWKLLGSVVYAHRQELITTIYIGFLVLIFSSFIMFLVEKDSIGERNETVLSNLSTLVSPSSMSHLIDTDRHKFETFADALWWGIITLCTVGYGDKVPSSYLGKLIAAICSFIGISFFALPAGILGSGFALKVQQQQRQKHYKRRKIPAVLLIQNLWRVYAADEKSLSQATWKVHVRPARENTDASLTSHTHLHSISSKFRANPSFLNRVSFRRRTTPRETPTTSPKSSAAKGPPNVTIAAMRSCIDTLSETASISPPVSLYLPPEASSSDNDDDHLYYANDVKALTAVHRHAIRFTRKVKYFVARRKFREALRPYDVTDVIEQYSTGNVDMLARMKYIQARLDKVLGSAKSSDSYESGPSLASRICHIEKQVDGLDLKVERLCQLANNLLDVHIRQLRLVSPPSPPPPIPIIINRIRTGSRSYVHRRRRRRGHHHPSRSPADLSHAEVTETSSPTNLTRPSSSLADHSHESLISLYSLLQENFNTPKLDPE